MQAIARDTQADLIFMSKAIEAAIGKERNAAIWQMFPPTFDLMNPLLGGSSKLRNIFCFPYALTGV